MLQPMITEAHLRQFVDDEQIFRFYIPQFKRIGVKFNIDENDKNPSACIFVAANGSILYKNFLNGNCYDAFHYVMMIKRLNYAKAIQAIATDLGIPTVTTVSVKNELPKQVEVNKTESKRKELRVKRKAFNRNELSYWGSIDIDENLLKFYEVAPLAMYWCEGIQYIPREMCFCYHFPEDDLYSYKLYFPINKHFISSASANAVQGYAQLDRSKKLCIITKSLKDVMFFRTIGINAVAPQSEHCGMPEHVIKDLCDNFDCYIWYDNDLPGRRGALKMARRMNLSRDRIIVISQKLRKEGVKDPTDMRKIKGRDFTLEYIKNLEILYGQTKLQREEGA